MSKFLHHDDNNDDTKAKAIPRVFSKNRQAKNFQAQIHASHTDQ